LTSRNSRSSSQLTLTTAARSAYRGLNDLARTAATIAPLPLSPYARVWGVWGREIRKFALVHPERKFMYASVRKVANTTIRRLLWRVLGVEVSGPDMQRTLHISSGPYLTLSDLAVAERDSFLVRDGVFRFAFVRNPYDRLRSAYLQKFLHPDASETSAHYLTALRWEGQQTPSFEEFIEAVVRQSDARMNIHWKPQHACLVWDAIPYDFIGRIETFDVDINHVLDRIGAPSSLYAPEISVNRVDRGSDQARDQAAYTKASAALVFQRFRRDFDLFGYAQDSYGGAGATR
jgi:hypothetical protein